MAENKWLGTTSNDINVAGNWGDGVPTANDACSFLLENVGGNAPAASMAALTLIDLDHLWVGPGYTKEIGGTGNHWEICADLVHYQGNRNAAGDAAKLWLKVGTAAGVIDNIICDSSDATPLTHDCLSITSQGANTAARLAVLRGLCTLESGARVTAITIGRRDAGLNQQCKLVINTGAVAPSTVVQYGGIASSMLNPTALTVIAGEWTQSQGGAVITTLDVFGGNVILQHGGTYTTVRHWGGTIDCTRGGGIKTFTNYLRMPGAILLGEGNPSLVSLPAAPPALTYIV